MKKLNTLQNIQINEKEEYALLSINPKIYPLDIIYSASYIMIDKAYIFLDGNPDEEIIVELRKRENTSLSLKEIVYDFNNELLNYAVYKQQAENNKIIRETILQKILLTNDQNYFSPEGNPHTEQNIEDPEEILKLWEESEIRLKDKEKPTIKKNSKNLINPKKSIK
jgi:His-Xaa-Ser system protein HxsD